MPRFSVVVFSVLIGAAISLPAAAQWKWRDTGGQIQYSDLPPPAGVADRDILQRPMASQHRYALAPASSASTVAAAPPKTVEPELEAKRRKAEQEQQAKQKADEEKQAAGRAENCGRAKVYMRSLDSGVRITRTNDKGEREFLDDTARADEARKAREVISHDCK